MAGLKRRQTEETDKPAEKKLKPSQPSKAEAKFALKLARGGKAKPSKPDTTLTINGKENAPEVENPKEEKVSKSLGPAKKKRKEVIPPTLPPTVEDSNESDTTEDENGFYGFSTNEEVNDVASTSGLEAEDESSNEKVVKKAKIEKVKAGKKEKTEAKTKGESKVMSNGKTTSDKKANLDGKANLESKSKAELSKSEKKAKPDGNSKSSSNGQVEPTDGTIGGSNSRESHIKQKAMAKERKASKPNADEIARAKKLWERLRRKSHVPKEERDKLLEELFEIVTGRVKDFVFKHDSVRTIQCALKYSTMPQRHMIAEELKGDYKSLAESRYAKFLIGKLLVEGDNHIRDLVVPEFYGHVRRLINHPEAAWILDDIYRGVASKEQKAILLREFFGQEFAIFKSAAVKKPTATLSDILAESPEKRKPIMDYLHGMINQLIQKKLTGFTILHDAMLQYFLNISPGGSEMGDFLKLIIGDTKEEEVDLLKNLAFTKPGSRVVCLALAHGTAKDRKQILRAYTDTISMLAIDPNGHKVLITAYDVVDDTRETTKRIFSELISLTKDATAEVQAEKILPLADNMIGRIPLLYPFAGAATRLINKQETQDLIKEIEVIRTTTSKKAPETRRLELVTALSLPLLTTVAENATTLVQSQYGCQFISEVILDAVGDKSAAVSAVAELAAGDPSVDDHISNSPYAGRLLKTLIAAGHFDLKQKKVVVSDANLGFHNELYNRINPFIKEWATGDSSFVVVALLEAEGFEYTVELKKKLIAVKKDLEKAATTAKVASKQETGVADGEVRGKKRKQRKDKDESAPKGNAGSRILLGMLNT